MEESLQLVGKIFVQNLKQYKSERLRDLEKEKIWYMSEQIWKN